MSERVKQKTPGRVMGNYMTVKELNEVYDILVEVGGAAEFFRADFVHAHDKCDCQEWRFAGHFGMGGKYRSERNRIDYYHENKTEEREILLDVVNMALIGDELASYLEDGFVIVNIKR